MSAEKTQWIDGSIKPSRPGVYEAEFMPGYTSFFNFSANGHWSVGAFTPDKAAKERDGQSNRPIHWRGLVQDPKATGGTP